MNASNFYSEIPLARALLLREVFSSESPHSWSFIFLFVADDAEICEIAAVTVEDPKSDQFQVYILPTHGIAPGTSAVNKLVVKHNILYYNGKPVHATSLADGISKFLDWLKSKQPCVLLAHNAKSFDAKYLMKALISCNKVDEFCKVVLGFSDTLSAFKGLYPERKSCSQENLAKDLLSASYNVHSALSDVCMLQELTVKCLTDDTLMEHSFTNPWLLDYIDFLTKKRKALFTLQLIIEAKTVSKTMADKIAASGLSLHHLQLAFKRGGADALSSVETEKFKGKPRVTSNKRIISSICSFFEN